MNVTLVSPCSDCPFLREGGIRLYPDRALAIATMMLDEGAGGTFTCHQSAGLGRRRRPKWKHSHCAGALLFAEKHGRQTAFMQVAHRCGFYDPERLQGTERVFDTVNEMLAVQLPERRR